MDPKKEKSRPIPEGSERNPGQGSPEAQTTDRAEMEQASVGLRPDTESLRREITEREKAEAALKQSEREYRNLFESAHDAILIFRPEDEVVLAVNQKACELYGFDRSEFPGMSLEKITKDVQGGKVHIQATLDKGFYHHFESVHFRRDGTEMLVEINTSRVNYQGRWAIQSINHDVTERKRAEAHLAYQAHLLDNLYDAVIAFDDHFVVKSWNKAAEELYGWKAEEVLGRTRQEMLHTEYIGTDWTQAIKSLKEAGEFQGELIQQRRDGRRIVVESKSLALRDADGRTGGYVSVNRDITLRKQAEEALQESEEKYRLLVENSGQGILVLQDGLLKFANPRALEYSGYSEAELTSTPFLDLVHPDDRGMIAERYQKRLKGEDIPPIYQFRFFDKRGQVKWVEVNSALIAWKGRPATLSFLSDFNERKRAEEALRESEEKYRLLSENAGDAILVAQEGKMRFVNPKAREYLGYSEQELTSRPFLEFIHPEDREMVMDRHLKRLRGEQVPQVYPFRIVSKGGKVRWVEIHAVVIAWQGAPATLNFLRDITDRKGAEEALRQSEALSRALIGHSPVGVSVRSRDGALLQVNEAWKRIWAMSDQEIQEAEQGSAGRSWEERCSYLGEDARDVERIFSSEGSISILFLPELEVKDPRPGTPRWITQYLYALRNEQGQVERVVTLTQDITKRKQAEETLHKLEQEKSLILSTVSEIVVYLDKGLRIAWANRAAGEEAGCTPEALVGRHCYEVWHGLSVLCENCPVAKALQTGTTQEGEVTSPQDRDWHIRAYPVLSDKGEVKGVVEVVREITERKLLEKELLQAQKMEAVGRLAGGVAHDFNNLLTSIMGYADLLAVKLEEDDPQRSYAEAILASANRAANLTQQLLSLSRRNAVQMQVLDPSALVAEVARMLRRLIGEDIELTTHAGGALGRVKADPVQISQVLMNLCINARDAMPRGGKLSIKTANVVLGESYTRRHREVAPGPYVMISVIDTGHGMDAEVQSHLFEPFFTTKEKGKGTGLGLSMAYGIVKQSNGHIEVESASGKGSTFKIYLPRVEEPLASPRLEAAPAELPRGTETVLVAEDEEKVRALVREVLQGEGYTVLEAGDGEEALEVAGRHQGTVHLLVTDVIMPRLGGPELARRLQLLRPDMKVLFMSGYTDGDISSYGGLGSEAPLLQKPFQPMALSRRVREVLETP